MKINKNYYVYKVVDPKTNQFYYGSRGCHCDPNDDKYMGSMKKWVPINRDSLIKYIIKIGFTTMNNAIEYESELIGKDIDNPLNENYYIPTEGFHTDGSIGHWHNKKRNESTKMKIKLSMIGQHDGKNNPMYGKKHTQSSIEKIKKSQIGKKHTQHSIQKMRESALKLNNKRGLSQNAIVVEHIPTGMIFDCILDAADYFSISRGTIRRHINNNVQLVGIKWRRIN